MRPTRRSPSASMTIAKRMTIPLSCKPLECDRSNSAPFACKFLQRVEGSLKVLRQWCLKLQRLSTFRVLKLNLQSMQRLPGDENLVLLRFGHVVFAVAGQNIADRQLFSPAVEMVGDNRSSQMLHVHSKLVSATCFGKQGDRREAAKTFEHLIKGRRLACIPSRFANEHFLAFDGVHAHVRFDVVAVELHIAPDDR